MDTVLRRLHRQVDMRIVVMARREEERRQCNRDPSRGVRVRNHRLLCSVTEHRGQAHQVTTDYINCAFGYKQTASTHLPCAFSLPVMTPSRALHRVTSLTREDESHDEARIMIQKKRELVKR